ncbi:MAG: hypothetical protein KKD18_05045 [Nanoarchaeota archaeon]|nr:hypothetical protein [Nanoarchaeota archaeon]MBU0977757.1 hypothetical protein [Nanoarchaeota archaeon]
MVRPISISKVIHAALISAFSIATALIWKDVVLHIIEKFAPAQNALMYEVLVAITATILLIIVLYIILRTESQAEFVMKKLKGGTVKFEKVQKKPKPDQIQKSK